MITRKKSLIISILSIALLCSSFIGYSYQAQATVNKSQVISLDKQKFIDEELNYCMEQKQNEEKMIKDGQAAFEDLFIKMENSPTKGSEAYLKVLFEMANPAGELRKNDFETWKLIDAYAYSYYVKNKESVNKSLFQNSQLTQPQISTLVASTYDRVAAVSYAHSYNGAQYGDTSSQGYNPYYYFSSSDCTNFVSQCLRKGQLPAVDGALTLYTDPADWYYHRNGTDSYDSAHNDGWSWSWVKVNSLYDHIINYSYGYNMGSSGGVLEGDFVQIDLDSNGTYDHTVIVSKIDSNGARRVCAHSNNRNDKLLSDYPGVKRYIHIN